MERGGTRKTLCCCKYIHKNMLFNEKCSKELFGFNLPLTAGLLCVVNV